MKWMCNNIITMRQSAILFQITVLKIKNLLIKNLLCEYTSRIIPNFNYRIHKLLYLKNRKYKADNLRQFVCL